MKIKLKKNQRKIIMENESQNDIKEPKQQNQDQKEEKTMSVEEAQELTKICCQHADEFLVNIREYFASRMEKYGNQWAVDNYLRMALIPGMYVARQSYSDTAIKEMMPTIEKMILEYKIVKEEENEV